MVNIKEIVKRAYNMEVLTNEECYELFHYLRHIPNCRKTEEEWELYKRVCKEKGIPEPNRKSCVRPLHEKYDENGNLTTPVIKDSELRELLKKI